MISRKNPSPILNSAVTGVILNAAPGSRSAGKAASPFCAIVNKDDTAKPVEVLIYDDIGKSDWTGEGFDAKDFVNELKEVDENRELHIRLNSRGGVVDDGIAIYNRIREWKGKTVAIIDGSAASIASVIAMGAKEVRMPKSAEILIHEAHGLAFGTASDMEEMSGRLEGASNRIAGIYARKTGKSVETMRDYMRKTTVFDGEQAKAIGLADELSDKEPIYNLSKEDIENFRLPPGKKKPKATEPNHIMNKEKLIAAIKKLGGTVAENATEEQLTAQLEGLIEAKVKEPTPKKDPADGDDKITAKDLLDIRKELEDERKLRAQEKKVRISAEIDKLIDGNQLPGKQREKAIARAMADETILDEYRALPAVLPGGEPVTNVIITSEAPADVVKGIDGYRKPTMAWIRNQGGVTGEQLRNNAMAIAAVCEKYAEKLKPILNTNTISADVKRVVILNEVIRAFARRLVAIRAFASVFANVPLQGTDEVVVPYYALDTQASVDFVQATGYAFTKDTNTSSRKVTINKRKYQPLNFNSSELIRQPYLDVTRLAGLRAEQLGVDVFNDVLSLVTAANFGAAAIAQPANAFDADDVADLMGLCDIANWPDMGRSLIIDSLYNASLCKDSTVRSVLNAGSDNALRNGSTGRLSKFDVIPCPNIPTNAENLKGMAVFMSALLVATSPVQPAPGVRQQLLSYDLVVEPQTGIAFEYRYWGDPDADEDREVIECNYGRQTGELAALKRITS